MNLIRNKGPTVDPGVCRCCGATKKCRFLNVEYDFEGHKEVYADIIFDSLGILLSNLEDRGAEGLICATCVVRLRDAKNFRKQVLRREEAFLQMQVNDSEAKMIEVQVVKEELNEEEQMHSLMSPHTDHSDPENIVEESLKAECAEDSCSNDDAPLIVRKLKKYKRHEVASSRTNSKEVVRKKCSASRSAVQRTSDVRCSKEGAVRSVMKQTSLRRQSTLQAVDRQRLERQQMLKFQEDARGRDRSYMVVSNVTTIIKNSYVCPFRCRHNLLFCYYCRQQFQDPEDLRHHTTKHDPSKLNVENRASEYRTTIKMDITNINCRLCPEIITDLDTFKLHISKVHGKKIYLEASDSLLPFRLSRNSMSCVFCEKTFLYFHALNQHMNEHYNNFVCETCGLGFVDQSRLIMHKIKHNTGTFPCEVCGKIFRNDNYRELHVDRVHKKLGKVYCPKCDVRLMSYYQKLKHLVEVHGEQPLNLPCTSCDKVFENRRSLTLHLRKYHMKDFRYECEYCGQKFFTRFSLRNHLPTHTGERNYKCKVCEKSYPRLKTLKDHIRIHTNDRRYRCHVCGQAFIQNCSLKGHMKTQHPEYG